MAERATTLLRELPSVDRLLKHPKSAALLARYNRNYITQKFRETLDHLRESIQKGNSVAAEELTDDSILAHAESLVLADGRPGLIRVVNATGTILHTNLGRALLPQAAIEALSRVGTNPVNLEYDLAEGRRGKREEGVEQALVELTGAEAATVVNNNAAAVLLGLNTLADAKEVIVSRGELIEIGGSFRIPEVMAKSGAKLKEVGSTNRTHPEDYEKAIGKKTALLLKVHTSNYKIVGFSAEVGLEELVAIGKRHEIPVMEDLGSGAFTDLSQYGLPKEPIVAERIKLGADIVTFSGDKVLGGPQAGLIVGRKAWLSRMNKNPLKRALRCGKLTLAALEATLRLYQQSANITEDIPTLRAFTRPLDEIEALGRRVMPELQKVLGGGFQLAVEDSTSQIGSGALPTEEIPTKVIAVSNPNMGAEKIARKFRTADPPILGRVKDNRFLLDLRTIFDPVDLVPNFTQPADKT
ncbi:MAG: L-seryl-tRNA(Sec) selenium transferase [Deltaproteobacteria bacterium RIFCSPLOWO2_12_FULL_60_19]|nr:MAG: L-seryl-tRNA(Sec) selenium transferase [Deltaproteobacteria bacterium RIFCSPLOWO2_12_FULL_60_19]